MLGRAAAIACVACLGLPSPVRAGDAPKDDDGALVESMGQPPTFMPYAGFTAGVTDPAGDASASTSVTVGLFRNVLSPISSIGVAGEGYLGVHDGSLDGGFRALALVRPLRFGAGIEYDIPDNAVDPIFTFLHPLRRGGLFGRGGQLRVDYLPTRDHTFQIGFVVPLGERWIGRTRPKSDHVVLSVPKQEPARTTAADPALADAIAHVRDSAAWIHRFATPFFDPDAVSRDRAMERFAERVRAFEDHMHERSPLGSAGRSYPEEIRVYHAELDRAFSIAASGGREARAPGESTELGRAISAAARRILLDEVILPYDRMLGRIKKPDSTLGFAAQARDAFAGWMSNEPGLAQSARPSVAFVLDEVLDEIEASRASAAKVWDTSELVWLPVHLALRPDELATGSQLETLLERAVETEFTPGNEQHYIVNEQFQWELLRQIRATKDYHVLWIHDYRGLDSQKELDELGFDEIYYGYLATLIDRVKKYDATGQLPTFMIFLDQNFYEPNRGRLWMSFLEDPLHAKLELPPSEDRDAKAAQIAQAQEELRRAVAGSKLLQQRAATYGDAWLRNRVKVHVNITNPVDWTFWSQRVIPLLGIPDVVMRDHRKISFYDVTEADPSRGEAIFTGMGVGEHYAGPTWEDRAMLVSGPALVGLKSAARDLLLSQGMAPDRMPEPLRAQPMPPDYAERVAALAAHRFRFRGMQLHNETGYAPKQIDVAKALLYDAMPAGSVIVVPDSLWNSPFWAGMLTGTALRGGRVFVIAPALDNAPSAGFPQMSRGQEIFAELIGVRQILGDEIAAAGGELRTGLYAIDVDVGDLASRVTQYYDHVEQNPFIQTMLGMTDEEWRSERRRSFVRARKERIVARLAEIGFEPRYVATDEAGRKPKLHLKAQLFLNDSAVQQLRRIDYTEIVDAYFEQWARQVRGRTGYVDARDLSLASQAAWIEQFHRVQAELPPAVVQATGAFLAVGSQNMDYRGMLMDGEVLYLTARGGVIPGLIDLFLLTGSCTWVDDLPALEALLPAYPEWQRWVGRFVKYAL